MSSSQSSSNNDGETGGTGLAANTESSSSSNTGDEAGIANEGRCRYAYPYDYFILETGCVPKDMECLKARWRYRKKRQDENMTLMDTEIFNAPTLTNEMDGLRESLRCFAKDRYLEHIRHLLKVHGFKREDDGQTCVTMKDMLSMIKDNPNLNTNKSDILFEIFHHKNNGWTSSTVDDWASSENIKITLPTTIVTKKRQPNITFFRGGFGPIVNTARMQSLKLIMRNMWKGQGWKIAVARSEAAADNGDKYTAKFWSKDQKQKYYIVEKTDIFDAVDEHPKDTVPIWQESTVQMDITIDELGVTAMADIIHAQLRLSLTHTQIRQISTIISDRKADNTITTVPAVPITITNTRKDNSGASITSALTEPSHIGRSAESVGNRIFSDFATWAASPAYGNGTMTFENGQCSYENTTAEEVSMYNKNTSQQQIPPAQPPNQKDISGDAVSTSESTTARQQMPPPPPPPKSPMKISDVATLQKPNDESVSSDCLGVQTVEKVVDPNQMQDKNQLNKKPCLHEQYDGSGYDVMSENAYFKDSYLSERLNAPKECAGCLKSFNAKKKEYVVGSKKPVHACPNARDLNSKCLHALCSPCYLPKSVKFASNGMTATGRRRKRGNK